MFVALFGVLGAALAGILFLGATLWFLDPEHHVRAVIIAIAVPVVLYLALQTGLNVGLPQGSSAARLRSIMSELMDRITALLTMQNILLLVGGVMIGMVVGVIPGVGPSAGLAILLPVTFGLDPTGAIVMLAAVYYGAMYGGTITSVLINTPGESATVASTFDGYPLAKQGGPGPRW